MKVNSSQALRRFFHLFRLFFNRQRSNEGGDFFGSLPLGQLAETFLAGPDGRVDDLQEELARSRIEDEDGAVDPGLR
jgi:hypothetical protein